MIRFLLFFIFSLILISCSSTSRINKLTSFGLSLEKADFTQLKSWQTDADSFSAFQKSCLALLKYKPEKDMGIAGKAQDWYNICKVALNPDTNSTLFFENNFIPYKVTYSGEDKGLFTGYYLPKLKGSRTKQGKYIYPIYKRPPELVDKTPYLTRQEIEEGALKNRNLELLYVDSLVDAFFMHIQGSGVIEFEDGSTTLIGFAGKNWQEFTPIGKYLLQNKKIKPAQSDANKISNWLNQNPTDIKEILWKNKSFIFFRELSSKAPVGAQGVELTKMSSLAVDPEYIPFGIPVWVQTNYPVTSISTGSELNRLFIAQDTGTAIKGAIRGDIYYGFGEEAKILAGGQKSTGSYYVLLPKN